ncbi:MAG: hypothetical protein GY797_21445 [Deltaproteobacteria bacterium]|nr:hypothetical protein [Deltaproteobacteria bacterium]
MNEYQFKNILGFFVIGLHLLLISSLVVLFLMGGYHFNEFTTILAIVLPITVIYVSAVVKHFVDISTCKQSAIRHLRMPYVVITMSLGFLFFGILICLVFLKAFNIGTITFEVLKVLIAITETGLGIYFSNLFFAYYERAK